MQRHANVQAPSRSVSDNYPTIYVQIKRVSRLDIVRISYRLTGVESSVLLWNPGEGESRELTLQIYCCGGLAWVPGGARGTEREGYNTARTGKGTYTPPPSSAMTQAAAAGSKHGDLGHVTIDVMKLVPSPPHSPH
ncbi:Hypp7148 [Branchiostoma lanceolatum]|uniref:Hypp7148 protein n=1 Tax=Branchiostoma lanceolatum TaxID=7740 RepID=A0A8J9YXZ3_BRALA|nr:Hypp7148 [Branchiostoma lanceolatum]